MMRKWSVVLGSLVGAFAIHGVLVACSSGGTTSNGPTSEGTAHADPSNTPATCTQWQVKVATPTNFNWQDVNYVDPKNGAQTARLPTIGTMTLEEGWEPIGSVYYSPLVRHCIK